MDDIKTVQMTAEELAAYAEFKKKKEAKELRDQREQTRIAYRELVDEQLVKTIQELEKVEEILTAAKQKVLDDFRDILDMKINDLKATKVNQRTHTFTSSNGKLKLKIGYNVIDQWMDTADDGIQMVKDSLEEFATNDEAKILAEGVLCLLSKDANGNLDKRKVLELEGWASKINNEKFDRGLELIKKSYTTAKSRLFIAASKRNDEANEWKAINLSLTNADCQDKEVEK